MKFAAAALRRLIGGLDRFEGDEFCIAEVEADFRTGKDFFFKDFLHAGVGFDYRSFFDAFWVADREADQESIPFFGDLRAGILFIIADLLESRILWIRARTVRGTEPRQG